MSASDFYDAYWSEDGTYPGAFVSRQLAAALERHLDSGTRCLDFGCGDGAPIGLAVRERARSYLGLDVSGVAVDGARSRGLEAHTVDPDAPLPVEDASFDVALAIEVFEHLVSPHRVAADLYRALVPGGSLIATVPNTAYWRRRLDLALLGRWNPRGDALSAAEPWRDPHLRFFTRASLRSMLAAAGFAPAEVRGHAGALLADLPALRRLARGRRGSAPCRALERVAPSLFGARLLAIARKPPEPEPSSAPAEPGSAAAAPGGSRR